jgi:sugar (pentulose or hexulose) kinase
MGGKTEGMRDLIIGADVGTSSLKAVLFSHDGRTLATARQSYPLAHPAPSRVEQNAGDWWQALVAAVRTLTRDVNPERVSALGLSTQGGTLVAVDARGGALHPAISWMDTRAQRQQAEFEESIGGEAMHVITGWNLCGGLNALQILWLKQNRPEVYESAAKFLSVPGYLTLRLTGRAAADYSSAGVEQLLDVQAGRYSQTILDLLGLKTQNLADLVPAYEPVGTLTAEAAEALGLSPDVLVVAGGHDQYCAALGAGAACGRDRVIATGTAWAVLAVADTPDAIGTPAAALSRHVAPSLWGALFSLDSGGSCVEWFRNACAPLCGGKPLTLTQVNLLAAESPAGSNGLLFYPFFSGAEYPAGLRNAQAGFYGLRPEHDVRHMARAVMEGVTCQAVWMLNALGDDAGGELILTGGASQSELWTGILADLAEHTLTLPETSEAGCVGAAALAGAASGLFASPAAGAARLGGRRRQVNPGPDRLAYREVLERYQNGAARMSPARRD